MTCVVCGRERFVKGGVLPPEQPDDAKHCLAWFSHRDGEDCYKLGYARLESELREARRDVAEVQAAREWITSRTGIGGGTRPLSFLTASHEQMARDRAAAESALSAERTARLAALADLENAESDRDTLRADLDSETKAGQRMREALEGGIDRFGVLVEDEEARATRGVRLSAAIRADRKALDAMRAALVAEPDPATPGKVEVKNG